MHFPDYEIEKGGSHLPEFPCLECHAKCLESHAVTSARPEKISRPRNYEKAGTEFGGGALVIMTCESWSKCAPGIHFLA